MTEKTFPVPEGEWLVIVNPNAGRRKGERDWTKISSLLNEYGLTFRAIFTHHRHHAIRLISDFIRKGFRKFIIVGGDGTLNEAVNGVMDQDICPSEEVLLALIPVGTGNDWGRYHQIPFDYEGAVKTILQGNTLLQDAGHVRYMTEGNIRERYFLNMAGMGYDALVAEKTNRQKDQGKGGPLSYLLNIFFSLFRYQHIKARIRLDDKATDAEVFSMNVGICRYNGGGMMQAPFANPQDGLLDLTIIKKLSKYMVIKNVTRLFDGSFTRLPMVFTGQGTNIEVISDHSLLLETDGESMGHTPCHFTIFPASLRVITGLDGASNKK